MEPGKIPYRRLRSLRRRLAARPEFVSVIDTIIPPVLLTERTPIDIEQLLRWAREKKLAHEVKKELGLA